MTLPVLAVALTVGAVVALILLGQRTRSLFEVRVDGRGATVRGTVPGLAAGDVGEFVESLRLPNGARIRGLPDGDRYRLEFSPQVPASEHQRIRNFFYSRL